MKSKKRITVPVRGLVLMTSLFMAFSFSCDTVQQNPLMGAWQFEHVKSIAGDTLYYEAPGNVDIEQIKMWSENHFVFVGQYDLDTSVMDNYGGGTYTLEGDRYEENIQFHTSASFVGNTVKMLIDIKNDTLIQTWPVDEKGEVDSSNYAVETYSRLD